MKSWSQIWKKVSLKDVLNYEQPNEYIISKPLKDDDSLTPVLTPNKSFIKGYTDEKNGIYNKIPAIIFDDFTTDNKFVNFPFKVKSSAMKILKLKRKDVLLKFVFYQMQIKKINKSTHKRYYISEYQNLDFIFPFNDKGFDLEQQQLIVDEIEKQLTRLDTSVKTFKELKKKLDVYRKSVLKTAFEGTLIKLTGKIIETTLSEEFKIIMGQSPKSQYYNSNKQGLPFFQGKKEFTNLYAKAETWTTKASKKAEKEDVLLSIRAPIGPVNLAPENCAIGRGLAAIKPNDKTPSKLIFYLIKLLNNELNKKGTGTTFRAITKSSLYSIPIKLPVEKGDRNKVLEEIESHFSIIDKLEKTVNNSLKKSEQLRKSILKSAFEGKLIKEVVV